MPRYDPLPSDVPSTTAVQSINPTSHLPPPSYLPPPNPQQYLQLAGEGPVPSSRPMHYSTHPRSPFACGACFDSIEAVIESLAVMVTPNRKAVTGYTAGFLFALGWWIFIDGAVYNAVKGSVPGGRFNQLAFEDWLPGILSTLALFIVNMIDRESLGADDSLYDGSNVAMKARGCAFAGITIALGSVGGALAILTLKYIIPGFNGDALYLGICITLQNFLIFIGSMVFWFGRNSEERGISL